MTRTVYLPIEEPPEGWIPPGSVRGALVRDVWAVEVLGPPIPAPPDLSPEARAVLEAAERYGRGEVGSNLVAAVDAYAASLAPPSPLAQARAALAEAMAATDEHARTNALRMVDRALEKMEGAQ